MCGRETEASKNQEQVFEPGQEAMPAEREMQVRQRGAVGSEELIP